jgi:hypothetical protein
MVSDEEQGCFERDWGGMCVVSSQVTPCRWVEDLRCVCQGHILGCSRKHESSGHFAFDEHGSSLVPLVGILLKNLRMVLTRLLAAFNDARQKAKKLHVGVVGVAHVLRCLCLS